MKKLFPIIALCSLALGVLAQESTPPPTPLVTHSADELVKILQSDAGLKDKTDACRELAAIGDDRALAALAGLLANEELSHMARYAIETMPGDAAGVVLRDQLPRLQGRQLIGVIASLGVRKDAKAVKLLQPLIRSTNAEIAQASARALGDIGNANAARVIEKALPKTAPANRLAFCEGLFRCAEGLAAKGETRKARSLYDRLRGLKDAPDQVRAGALRGAILIRGGSGTGLLKESLASSDWFLFAAAVRASMEMPGGEVTGILAAKLPRLAPDNQIVVLQALGSRGDIKALPALSAQASQGGKATRVAAIRAIAAIGHPLSVKVLVEMIGDLALAGDPVAGSEREILLAAQDGLAGIPGREADAAALKFMDSPQTTLRLIGIDLVGRRRLVVAMPSLLGAASATDAKVRSAAVQRVGKLGTPSEAPALIAQMLRSTDAQDLDGLAGALGNICIRAGSPPSATDQVINALASATPAQKGALLSVLGALGGEKSFATVRAALSDPNADVHSAAVEALAGWPDSAALPDLLQIARSTTNSAERDLAFRGGVRLARESSASEDEKLKRLAELAALAKDTTERKLVLAGLGDVISVESLQMAAPYLSDPEVVEEAAAVSVKIAGRLDARHSAEIGLVLNQVLKSARTPQSLDAARKRMEQLKLPVQ